MYTNIITWTDMTSTKLQYILPIHVQNTTHIMRNIINNCLEKEKQPKLDSPITSLTKIEETMQKK